MSFSGPIYLETPVEYVYPQRIITSVSYSIIDFKLFDHATFNIMLYDQYGLLIEARIINIAGCDYANWTNDDTYIVRYVQKQFGFHISLTNLTLNNYNKCHFYSSDISGQYNIYAKLLLDPSTNEVILPNGYSRDTSNNIIDFSGNVVAYEYLYYDPNGRPVTVGLLQLDASNNAILPEGFIINSDGVVTDVSGTYIVIVSPTTD